MKVDLNFQPKDELFSVLYKKAAELDAAENDNKERKAGLSAMLTLDARSYEGLKIKVSINVYHYQEQGRSIDFFKKDFVLHEQTEESLTEIFDEAIAVLMQDAKSIQVKTIDLAIEKLQAEKEALENK